MPSQSSSVNILTHYAVLGVTEAAAKNEIAKAFRTLALSLHPDRKAGLQDSKEHDAYPVVVDSSEPSSTTVTTDPHHILVGARNANSSETGKSTQIVAFTEAAEAYEILSDPLKRAEYDQKLALERAEAEGANVEEAGIALKGDHLLRKTKRPSSGIHESSSMREHVQGGHIPADILRRPPTGSSSAAAGARHYTSFESDPMLPSLNSNTNTISHALHRRPPTAPLGTCTSPIGFSSSGGGGGAFYGAEEVRQQWDEHFLERKDGKLERRRPASTRRQQSSRPCSGTPLSAMLVGGNAAVSERDNHRFTPSPMPMPLPRGGSGSGVAARFSAGAWRTQIPSRQASAAHDRQGCAHIVISEDTHENQGRAMQTNGGDDLSERVSPRRRSGDTTCSVPSEEDRPSTSLPNVSVRRNSIKLDDFHQAEAHIHVRPEGCTTSPLHVPLGGSNRPAAGSLSKPPTPLGAARVRQLKHLREKMSSATSGSYRSSSSTPVSCSATRQVGGSLGIKPEASSEKRGNLDPRINSALSEREAPHATPIGEISVEGRRRDSLPRPNKGVEDDQSIHDQARPANTKMQTSVASANRPPTPNTRVHAVQSSPLDLLPELDEGAEVIEGLSFGLYASSLPQRYPSVRSSTNGPTATPVALKLDQFASPFRRAASSSLRDRLYRTTGSTPVVLPSRQQGRLQSPPFVTMPNAVNTSDMNKASFTSGASTRSRLPQQSTPQNVSVLRNGNRAATPAGSSGQSSAALRTLEVFFSSNTSSRVSPPSSSSSPSRPLQRGERAFRSHTSLM